MNIRRRLHRLLLITLRPARWHLTVLLPLSIVFALLTIKISPLPYYPAGTMLIGLVCGLASFSCGEFGGLQWTLRARRLRPVRIWVINVGLWGLTAALLALLVWSLASVVDYFASIFGHVLEFRSGGSEQKVCHGWQAGLWVTNGFCIGQFFAFWTCRPIIAAVLASSLALVSAALWLPLVVFSDLSPGQVAGVPVLFLLGTGLFVFRRSAGRLYSLPSLAGLSALVTLGAIWITGALYHRVIEVPDVGEPFDVQTFAAGVPALEKNDAGRLIRQAVAQLNQLRDDDPASFDRWAAQLGQVNENSWPKADAALSRWLDHVFQKQWSQDIYRAARSPLGVVHDPRRIESHFGESSSRLMYLDVWRLLESRVLQLRATGNFAGVLEHLETILGLSRQLRNYAPTNFASIADHLEHTGLRRTRQWLETIGPQPDLLDRALTMLHDHEKELPDRRDAVKAQYLVREELLDHSFASCQESERRTSFWRALLWTLSRHIPWERSRQGRLTNAIYKACAAPESQKERLPGAQGETTGAGIMALEVGFPLRNGVGSDLTASQWGQLIAQSWIFCAGHGRNYSPTVTLDILVRGELLTTALALFHAQSGKPAAKLDDLVPRFLPRLPDDPLTGQPFQYRLSKGERIDAYFRGALRTVRLADGQGLVWSAHADPGSAPDFELLFPVPSWNNGR